MGVSESNLKKFVGFGRVYLDATVPADFGSPTLAGGVPAEGTDVGATIGATEFKYKANVKAFEIEQSTTPILPAVDSEEASLTVRMAEQSYSNLKYVMQTFARDVAGRKVLHLGGQLDVTGHSVTVVAEMPSAPGKYYGAMLYSAYIDSEVTIPIKRADTTKVIEATFKGQSVTTRAKGDQIGQWFEDQ